MTQPSSHRSNKRDFRATDLQAYREVSAKLPEALSIHFLCNRCDPPAYRPTLGSRSIPKENLCRKEKICAACWIESVAA
jgi:hypothetical protein